MAKKYPFSLRKHEHDLLFRRNRAMNEMSDKEYEGTLTEEERQQYQKLIDDLGEITLYFPDSRGIVFLPGREWALANETVAWAEAMRS